jgi:hypothetical protein
MSGIRVDAATKLYHCFETRTSGEKLKHPQFSSENYRGSGRRNIYQQAVAMIEAPENVEVVEKLCAELFKENINLVQK